MDWIAMYSKTFFFIFSTCPTCQHVNRYERDKDFKDKWPVWDIITDNCTRQNQIWGDLFVKKVLQYIEPVTHS